MDRFLKQFGQLQKTWGEKDPIDAKEKLLKDNQVKRDNTQIQNIKHPSKKS